MNETGWDEKGGRFLLPIQKEDEEETANRIATVLQRYNLPLKSAGKRLATTTATTRGIYR